MTKGIKPARDFMLGGGHTYMFSGPFKSSLSLNLNERPPSKRSVPTAIRH